MSVWGNDDCDRLPDPATIEYVVLDKTQIGVGNFDLFDAMIVEGGPFEVIYESTSVVVLRRTGTSVAVDVAPQEASCSLLDLRYPDR